MVWEYGHSLRRVADMNAANEIAALTLRVRELEDEAEGLHGELEVAQREADVANEDADSLARQLEDAQWELKQRAAIAEFIEDVRRGIRSLDEYEAVCA